MAKPDDGYWINPKTSFKMTVLKAEGESSEFKATINDTAETVSEDWGDLTLVDLDIHMQEYPAQLLLARLDALRNALATWIDLADDPSAAPITLKLSQQIQKTLEGARHE